MSAEKSFAFPKFEYLIEDVFPTQEIHLIAGPSGAGKSTWLLKFIDNWRQGKSFFSHAATPLPFMYISYDRSRKGVLRVFQRLHLNPADFNLYVPTGTDKVTALKTKLNALLDKHPDIRVFFIEGFATKVPDGKINDQKIVADFLGQLQELCEARNITIFGVVHTAKTREKDRYDNPRQRISGTIAWAGYSETIVIVEPKSPDNPADTTRRLMILPRNAPEVTKEFAFVNGELIEKKPPKPAQDQVAAWLVQQPVGREFAPEAVVLATGLPKTTVGEILKRMSDGAVKAIERVRHGVYRKVDPTTAN